jgi:hypothetical protein
LIYECIVGGILDYDYSPFLTLITQDGHSQRKFLNISQEGKSAIDDLREAKLINGLKLSSEDFQPITSYQVSKAGMDFIQKFPPELRRQVDSVIKHHGYDGYKPIQVAVVDDKFVLKYENEKVRESNVDETEDVSYVSSPFLPACVRISDKELTSNSHRSHESATGSSNIKDELDEVRHQFGRLTSQAIHLSNVNIMIGEWIPFGSNQIVALNERLGSMDRCQVGFSGRF